MHGRYCRSGFLDRETPIIIFFQASVMKFKAVFAGVVVFIFTSTMFAGDNKILFEIRTAKTVDFSRAAFEFVGERRAQGRPLATAALRQEGTNNVFQESIVLTTLYRERRFAVIISPDGDGKGVAQVFRLPIHQNSKPSDWSQWQRPHYLENSRDAISNFMDDRISPERSTNIPPDFFEVRYKIEDAK